jgi:osmoprotectant transport system substrate-binding protein
MRFLRHAVAVIAASMALASCGGTRGDTFVVGSKNFTEQAILGELIAQQIEGKSKVHVVRRFYLSGSYICQQALLAGRIDTYVEYTGTALTAILKEAPVSDRAAAFERVKDEYARRFNLVVAPPLGFNNTFAIVVRGEDARRLGIRALSQAVPYAPQWRAGFGYEFMGRPDGYAGLAATYGLHFGSSPRIMDLGLLYRALLDKQVDIVAGNSTDGLLAARDLTILEDDKHYFPPYEAVPIVRPSALEQHPEIRAALDELAGKISDKEMQRMNYAVDGEHRDTAEVVREFLHAKGLD